jgi:TetR/AcrR family transcriptional regulator, transcriptional repressor for nem operon
MFIMRVTKEKAAEHHRALVRAASKLFRKHGIEGVGVADIGKAAGLTHGALYAQFPSKEALAAEALTDALDQSYERMIDFADDRSSPIGAYLDFFINKRHRDDLSRGKGCAMTASGSEIARQGRSLSRSFTDGFDRFARTVEAGMGKAPLASTPRQRALTIAAAAIGAIVAARAVAKADPALSGEILDAARRVLGEAGGESAALNDPVARGGLPSRAAS